MGGRLLGGGLGGEVGVLSTVSASAGDAGLGSGAPSPCTMLVEGAAGLGAVCCASAAPS